MASIIHISIETAFIRSVLIRPATLRLTGSGVNAVGEDLIETAVKEAYEEKGEGQSFL